MKREDHLYKLFCRMQYRDTVRQFIKGTDGFAGAFAECLCGSPNLYQVFRLNLVTVLVPCVIKLPDIGPVLFLIDKKII